MSVVANPSGSTWIVRGGEESEDCESIADVVYFVEKILTIELQLLRPDLYFLHAAAIALDGNVTLLVGESGAGKSTLCWDLCHAGFSYLSDELAPVSIDTRAVEPYPHAICLKAVAEGIPPIPSASIQTSRTLHIPTEFIPHVNNAGPFVLGAIVFLRKTAESDSPSPNIGPLDSSEAAARIYANALNQLAHEREGLSAAVTLAKTVSCYQLDRQPIADMRRQVTLLAQGGSAPQ